MAAFITFEGIEGSGKTTQIRLLAQHLEAQGYRVQLTREPGGCPISDQIRAILLHPDNAAMRPRAELLLYAAARAQHVDQVIRPALAAGTIVLCDRFSDATHAYQGAGRGLDRGLIEQLDRLAAADCTPDLTLLFDLPVAIGLQRARRREEERQETPEGRFEEEDLAFHERIRSGYLSLAATAPGRFRTLAADRPPGDIQQRVAELVEIFLTEQRSP